LRALPSAGDLVIYTDQVAGCVGRLWTTVGFFCYPEFSRLAPDELSALGTRFGQALQLVNILRDLPEDLDAGRCYLPQEELQREGWHNNLPWRSQMGILRSVSAPWETRAEEGLRDGLVYANSLPQPRSRIATALPALLGLQTLQLLRREPQQRFAGKLKIPKSDLRRALGKTVVAALLRRPVTPP
jgi:farnesyl-diphosphate farnesyltransferase